jgi:hypothetical protein
LKKKYWYSRSFRNSLGSVVAMAVALALSLPGS